MYLTTAIAQVSNTTTIKRLFRAERNIPGAPNFARVRAPTNGLQYSYNRRKPSASVGTILLAPTINTGCLADNDTLLYYHHLMISDHDITET
jgi:hypothetical protein